MCSQHPSTFKSKYVGRFTPESWSFKCNLNVSFFPYGDIFISIRKETEVTPLHLKLELLYVGRIYLLNAAISNRDAQVEQLECYFLWNPGCHGSDECLRCWPCTEQIQYVAKDASVLGVATKEGRPGRPLYCNHVFRKLSHALKSHGKTRGR